MNNSILWEKNKFRIPFISTLIILFSLSCDESAPSTSPTPDFIYNIAIQSQVRNCEQVSCIDDLDNEAYGANVNCEETSCEDSYHLYFQIILTDEENDPIANAILTIEECPAIYSEPVQDSVLECSGEITNSDFISFTGDKITNDEGVLEGYWMDSNENGNFIITIGYEDEYENSTEASHNILIHPMGGLVDFLSIYTDPSGIIFINDQADEDTTQYSVEIIANLMDENNIALANIPINFSITNSNAPATLSIANVLTDNEGSCTTTANILKNEIDKKDSLKIFVSSSVMDTQVDTLIQEVVDSSTVYIYTDSYYQLEQTNELRIDLENPFDPETNSYETTFNATVLDPSGAVMSGVAVNFDKITAGVGSFDVSSAETGEDGSPATAIFTMSADEVENIPDDGIVTVEFEISVAGHEILPEDHPLYFPHEESLDYQLSDNTEPEYEVAYFSFHPDDDSLAYDLGTSIDISVIGIDMFGAGVSDAQIYFSLAKNQFYCSEEGDCTGDEATQEDCEACNGEWTRKDGSNGQISIQAASTCCESEGDSGGDDGGDDSTGGDDGGEFDGGGEDTGGSDTGGGDTGGGTSSNQDPGVANVSYSSLNNGDDMLYAEIRDPFNANIILKQDSLLIKSSNACIDCEETLTLISSFYELEALSGPDTTNVYAFYTDSDGIPAELNTFVTFETFKDENFDDECDDFEMPDDDGDGIGDGDGICDPNGIVDPASAIFKEGVVSDLDPTIFPGSPPDSSIVYAETTFHMEGAEGLIEIKGIYNPSAASGEDGDSSELESTINVYLSSAKAAAINFPLAQGEIAVEGSADHEEETITMTIVDGNGNTVNDCYTVKFKLTDAAVATGVHLNGNQSLTETYTESEDGRPYITIHSGTSPTDIGIRATVYDGCNLDTSNEEILEELYITEAFGVPLVVISGPPTYGGLNYSFGEAINIGGGISQMPVSIMLWDTWANEVPDGTEVLFTLEPENLAYIFGSGYTGNQNPQTADSTSGIAWTTIQYASNNLFQFPEVIATTTGSYCTDNSGEVTGEPYDECTDNQNNWITEAPLSFSSLGNSNQYQNVCVECNLTLVPLSDIQNDYECAGNDFSIDLRAQLLDFYGNPVEGAMIQLLALGTQGGPLIEAYQFLEEEFGCFIDGDDNGVFDNGETQTDSETEDECFSDQEFACFFDVNGNDIWDENSDFLEDSEVAEEECSTITPQGCFLDANGDDIFDPESDSYGPGFSTSTQCEDFGWTWGSLGNAQWGLITPSEFTWGLIQQEETNLIPEPPYDVVLTDENGWKFFRITFFDAECVQTGFGPPDAYSCSTPSLSALLLNPNQVESDEISINLQKTCPGD